MRTVSLARPNAGFTLIEVLIATVLLSIMMLLMIDSLQVAARAWGSGEARLTKVSNMLTVESFLRSHLAGILPIVVVNQPDEPPYFFRGGSTSMAYVATLPDHAEARGVYQFRLFVEDLPERRDLQLAITTMGRPGVLGEPIDTVTLLEDVGVFKLSYLFVPLGAGQQQGIWLEQWQQSGLPSAIRLQIEPQGGDPWPLLVIATRIQP